MAPPSTERVHALRNRLTNQRSPRPAPLTSAERSRRYRERIRNQALPRPAPLTGAERTRRHREHLQNQVSPRPAPLTSAERSRRYRERIRNQALPRPAPLTGAERTRRHRERLRPSPRSQPATGAERVRRHRSRLAEVAEESGRCSTIANHWRAATRQFEKSFLEDSLGHTCDVCDRIWFKSDLKPIKPGHMQVLFADFGEDARLFKVCSNCYEFLNRSKMPALSKSNGFIYPEKPQNLPQLDPITTRLISPRIPFMAIRRLRRDGQYGIIGQVINVPVNVDTVVRSLPRQLDDDYSFNVALKRKLIHKSTYLSGFVKKSVVRDWLSYLVNQPLYRHLGVRIDSEFLNSLSEGNQGDGELIEELERNSNNNEALIARQHTILWDESYVLTLAPGQNNRPLNLIFDSFAEELSFPDIYFGKARNFRVGVRVTPYMMATSEIRRRDRRGAKPEHILYMVMKILRLRIVDGMRNTFRCVRQTENITRSMIQDPTFLRDCIDKNFSFLKTLPNSAQYWNGRKRDVFAMMRQLGKPTAFMTLSADETNWPHLLMTLNRLSGHSEDLIDPINELNRSTRANLVNEDPVTCCIYFQRLVDTVMKLLCAKKTYNPFGKYRVLEYFMRIEFQHRGSPHAHLLLWLENDPKEQISEDMPLTVQLVTDLLSVARIDLAEPLYANQVHRHTFTCTKRGESSCRFNIPYWPVRATRILLPMAKNDQRVSGYRAMAKRVRENLETKSYTTYDEFMLDNNLNEETYCLVIKSTLQKPTLIFKRDITEIMTNTFNPWIANNLKSNMDIQFIVDAFSCANYVVDYVNKADRGSGNLHRELLKLSESHPELVHEQLLRKIGSKILNTVEMSAQEAAWVLLRQPMSRCSREVIYIPTCMPCERQKAFKSKAQLERENVTPESTDIWTKNIIQKYEDRSQDLRALCLADFCSLYSETRRVNNNDLENDNSDNDTDNEDLPLHHGPSRSYKRRKCGRVIRYHNYDPEEINNFKREMVTLFFAFENEQVDIIDRNKYVTIFEENLNAIMAKRCEYESGFDLDQVMAEIRQISDSRERTTTDAVVQRENFARQILSQDEENFDDFNINVTTDVISGVSKRSNILSKEEYCTLMRTTNPRQREIILEVIHRLSSTERLPIQVFFTGPAGCGKTYTLRLLMETYNRFSQNNNILTNSYVACASTGKAAVNLGGLTVHSAFHITQSRRSDSIGRERIQSFRQLFVNVRVIFIDEVSMIGSDILHRINHRLQEITGMLEANFGAMDMFFCGDFKQLPPVLATPVYKGTRSHIERSLLWQSLDYYPLCQVMRQADTVFSTILTKIGQGQPLSQSESQLIESRFRTEQWCEVNLKGVIRLYHQNHSVDAYNRRAIEGGIEVPAVDVMLGHSNNEQLSTARAKLHKMSTMETAGLPFILKIATGYPYMLTANIDVEDGLVNGSLGVMKYIEELPGTSNEESLQLRVWMRFPDEKTGTKARVKLRSAVVNRPDDIQTDWTPISCRSASISLGGPMRCRRIQFPLAPACAITIHKSQGGTFDQAVINYSKTQQTQLVYVGLSRVTSIDGLYLVNDKKDHIFYHKNGSSAPSIREIRDEYARLEQHPLKTLQKELTEFKNVHNENIQKLILCTINAQSLLAHFLDIQTDINLTESDILIMTETWMDDDHPVEIQGFEIVSKSNKSSARLATRSQQRSALQLQDRRIAGGVAIYRNQLSQATCRPIHISVNDMRRMSDSSIGDFSLAEVQFNNNKFIIAAFYIHPRISQNNLKIFLYYALADYTAATRRLIPTANVDLEIPMLISGDFNIDISKETWIIDFMSEEFQLQIVRSSKPTTLGNTIIDLSFARNLSVECMPFVSYFSYHRPLFNKLSFE